jgi:hypothetical protein
MELKRGCSFVLAHVDDKHENTANGHDFGHGTIPLVVHSKKIPSVTYVWCVPLLSLLFKFTFQPQNS